MRKASTPGQLFSVDAMRGRDAVQAAKRLFHTRQKREGGFSIWDASSIFFELHSLKPDEKPSARTMVLLYAADLHFRLRWQIMPALEEGQTVIAAPYVETGKAFGIAMGIPRRWLNEVFRFAPKPSAAFWVHGTPASTASPTSGFIEFCNGILPPDFFDKFGAHFGALQRKGRCRPFRP